MALWDRGAQSRCLVRASAPLPQARHPPANPTGAAPARPLSLLPCRATPAAPGRPLLPPSPHQLLAAAQILPHPPLSITPSAFRAEPRPFPALRGLQAAALPSLCASSWPQVPAPSAAPVLLRHLKCPCLSALPGLLLPPGVLTSSVYPSPTSSTGEKAGVNQDTDAGPHPSPGMCRQTASQHVSLCAESDIARQQEMVLPALLSKYTSGPAGLLNLLELIWCLTSLLGARSACPPQYPSHAERGGGMSPNPGLTYNGHYGKQWPACSWLVITQGDDHKPGTS